MNERNLLAERLRDVIQDGLVQDARAWCEAAGLSGGFLSSFFVRAKSKPDARTLDGPPNVAKSPTYLRWGATINLRYLSSSLDS